MASSVALTLRKATTATMPTSFFNKFLRLKPPSTAISPLTNHCCFCSTTHKTPESDPETRENSSGKHDPPLQIKGSPQEFKMENPFQSVGPKDVVAVDEVKDGLLVRITLPGVCENGCKVWVENNTVFFAGKGEIECENENSGRCYGGSLEFDPEFNKVEEIKSEMKHGILRMTIPKVGGPEGVLEEKDQKK